MLLARIMFNPKLSVGILFLLASLAASSQENSPYSRYGLGDIYPSQNIVNRTMGGASVTYKSFQSINFNNPASYSAFIVNQRPEGFNYMVYDIGATIETRVLKSTNPVNKFNTNNFTPSYFALGVPLNKKRNLGMAFGLRPLTRINYSITSGRSFDQSAKDSIVNLFEGDGGLNQVFVGIGKRWGGFSAGFNTGYNFGKKNITTKVFFNDTIPLPIYKSNSGNSTTFGNFFISGGLQYEAKLSNRSKMVFGLSGNLKQKLNAKQDIVRETFEYDANGATFRVDSVFQSNNVKGTIELPASYNAGIAIIGSKKNKQGTSIENSIVMIEYEASKWSDYTFYSQKDKLTDAWKLRIGGQITPNPLGVTKYLNLVTYRAGFYVGRDYIMADGNTLPVYAFTLGAGLPIRKWRSYDNQFTNINLGLELGKKGNTSNAITENFFRFSVGLNLSDIWFIKRKYD